MSTEDLAARVAELEERMHQLEASRPGRKARKLERPMEAGVCGLAPECNSNECEDSSVYRYQLGCRGGACVKKNSVYYAEYRRKRKVSENGFDSGYEETPVGVS